ncbi:MAG: tetratricopeptide repeat protein [Rhodanobacteraceae bacterium]
MGQHNLRENNCDLALQFLEKALAREPDDLNALNLCGVANYRCGNLDRAEVLLGSAARKLPGHRAILENLALVTAARRSS